MDFISKTLIHEAVHAGYDLRRFSKIAWPIVNPGVELVWGMPMDVVCEHLQAVQSGQIRRLVINIPPGHSKSTLVSQMFPCWNWVRNPHHRMAFASYAKDISYKESRNRKKILTNPWYQRMFMDRVAPLYKADGSPCEKFSLDKDSINVGEIINTRMGSLYATSVNGSVTGRHFDIAITDDPINPRNRFGVEMHTHVDWFFNVYMSRVKDPSQAAFIVTMQRVGKNDLSGVIKEMGGWEIVSLPALYSTKNFYVTSIGWSDPRTEDGELLYPERFDREYMIQKRKEMSEADFNAQYQQEPISEDGALIKPAWIKYFDQEPESFEYKVISIDPTFDKTKGADLTAIQVWGMNRNKESKQNEYFLIESHAEQVEMNEAVEMLKDIHSRHKDASKVLIEKSANGPAIQSMIKKEDVRIYSKISLIQARSAKIARVQQAGRCFMNGQVYLPSVTLRPWILDLVDEMISFPAVKNDDRVDAAAQAINYMYYTLSQPIDDEMASKIRKMNKRVISF